MVVRPYGLNCLFAEVIGECGLGARKQELSPWVGVPRSEHVCEPPSGREVAHRCAYKQLYITLAV